MKDDFLSRNSDFRLSGIALSYHRTGDGKCPGILRLEQEHLQKLKKLEEQHRSKKQSLGKQLSQIEGLQKEKEARLTKLTFLQFLEKRTLAAELMDLDKQKRELLALIQTAESDYVTMRDQEHMNFNLLLVEKGL